MCGRLTFINIDEIRERFKAEPIDLKPNYNVAPTQNVILNPIGETVN